MNNITIENRRLPFEFVYETLKKVSSLFTPPLSESLDIEAYAIKLSDKAEFAVCMDEDDMLGFTAYYLNKAAHQIYVTLICVDTSHQAQGIGGKMIDCLSSFAKNEECNSIALEVKKQNDKAHRFYLKQGFSEQENRGEKLLMVKNL